jgi:predicted amidophosphoribosyltransferase
MATMTDRLINLHGAFAVPRTDVFLGKHICLIDDVTTTGTTLRVAAQTIRKAGAKRISAAVLAVAADN